MGTLAGIEREGRLQLTEILRRGKPVFTVSEATTILNLSAVQASKLMSRWVEQGWLIRLRRGLYAPVPLETKTLAAVIEDPWVVAMRLFEPCYIGGFSAAEYWGFTEQIFKTVIVLTTKNITSRMVEIQTTKFKAKKISSFRFFGVKAVWRGKVRIHVSDPTKTIVDLLDDPSIGGGARLVETIFLAYLSSRYKDMEKLLEGSRRMKNGAVLKRLGYFLERAGKEEKAFLSKAREQMTTGNVKLDPAYKGINRLVTRWRLWIPAGWERTVDVNHD